MNELTKLIGIAFMYPLSVSRQNTPSTVTAVHQHPYRQKFTDVSNQYASIAIS